MKITLYLMTKKGFDVLNSLVGTSFQRLIATVVIGKDKNIDNDYSKEIRQLCNQHDINFLDRKDKNTVASDYAIAISWRWLILNNMAKLIVLHDSLLPKYRGFAPLVNMLINKEPEIGVSAIFASTEYDRGEIIAQSSTKINYPIKIATAIELVAKNYVQLVKQIFQILSKEGQIEATPQDETLATYSLWRNEADYLIDWSKDANYIKGFIYAVGAPYKGASTLMNGKQKIRILDAEVAPDVHIVNRDIGKVIFIRDKRPIIVCGSGLLKLNQVIDDETKENLLPFKNFRVRLGG